MPTVQGGYSSNAKALRDRDDRSVRTSKREVLVRLDQFRHARQVLSKDRDEREPVIGCQLTQKPGLDLAAAPALQEIADLGQDGVGNQQRLIGCLNPFDAAPMIGVAGVDQGDKRPRIDHDHRSGGFGFAELCPEHVLGPAAKISFPGIRDSDKAGTAGLPAGACYETQRFQRVACAVLRDRLDKLMQLLSLSHTHMIATRADLLTPRARSVTFRPAACSNAAILRYSRPPPRGNAMN
jgi:hypothetical protein